LSSSSSPTLCSPQQPSESPPPEPLPPSNFIVCLVRWMESESQLDFTYAKHLLLIRKQKLLRSQIEKLEQLPVGAEAFQEDLNRWIANLATTTTTTTTTRSLLKSERETCNSGTYQVKDVKDEEDELYGELDGIKSSPSSS
jgi:hypothetical protein